MGKRNSQLQELTVVAQNDYLTIVDTSAGQSKRVSVKTLVGNVDLGWVATGESWTYTSWSSGTRVGVATVPSDATTKYTAGMRVRFSQTTGGTKYAIIIGVTTTTLTLFFPTGTTFTNETITSPVYSSIKVPYGFNVDPANWKLRVYASETANRAAGAYFNPSGAQLVVPIGAWRVRLKGVMAQDNATAEGIYTLMGLSTSNSSMTDADLKVGTYTRSSSTSGHEFPAVVQADKYYASQTTYYVNVVSAQVAGTTAIGLVSGYNGNSYAEATCNYL